MTEPKDGNYQLANGDWVNLKTVDFIHYSPASDDAPARLVIYESVGHIVNFAGSEEALAYRDKIAKLVNKEWGNCE